MIDELLLKLKAAENLSAASEILGQEIGLTGSTPESVTKRVLEDLEYAKALFGFRNLPEMRDRVLASADRTEGAPKSISIAKKATKSAVKWGMAGMKPAKPWDISRRIDACNACHHQVPAPDTLLYKGAKVVVGKDAKICNICNCLTNTKAAISTEHCPVQSEDNPKLSKWGESWVPPEDHPEGPW